MSNTMHQLSYSNDLFFKYTLSREDEGSVYARNTIQGMLRPNLPVRHNLF